MGRLEKAAFAKGFEISEKNLCASQKQFLPVRRERFIKKNKE